MPGRAATNPQSNVHSYLTYHYTTSQLYPIKLHVAISLLARPCYMPSHLALSVMSKLIDLKGCCCLLLSSFTQQWTHVWSPLETQQNAKLHITNLLALFFIPLFLGIVLQLLLLLLLPQRSFSSHTSGQDIMTKHLRQVAMITAHAPCAFLKVSYPSSFGCWHAYC